MRTFGTVVLVLIFFVLLYIAIQQRKGNELVFCLVKFPKNKILVEVEQNKIKKEEVSKIIPTFSLNSFTGTR